MSVSLSLLASAGAAITNVHPERPPGLTKIDTLINWLTWGCYVAGLVGLLMAVASLAINHQRGSMGEGSMTRIGTVAIALVAIGAVGSLANFLVF